MEKYELKDNTALYGKETGESQRPPFPPSLNDLKRKHNLKRVGSERTPPNHAYHVDHRQRQGGPVAHRAVESRTTATACRGYRVQGHGSCWQPPVAAPQHSTLTWLMLMRALLTLILILILPLGLLVPSE